MHEMQSLAESGARADAILDRELELFDVFSEVSCNLRVRQRAIDQKGLCPQRITIYQPNVIADNQNTEYPEAAVLLAKYEQVQLKNLVEARRVGLSTYFASAHTERVVSARLLVFESIRAVRSKGPDKVFKRPYMEVMGPGSMIESVLVDPTFVICPTNQISQERWLEELEYRQGGYANWLGKLAAQRLAFKLAGNPPL